MADVVNKLLENQFGLFLGETIRDIHNESTMEILNDGNFQLTVKIIFSPDIKFDPNSTNDNKIPPNANYAVLELGDHFNGKPKLNYTFFDGELSFNLSAVPLGTKGTHGG